MKKNPHGRILRGEPNEQYLSIVLRSCPLINRGFQPITTSWKLLWTFLKVKKIPSLSNQWVNDFSNKCFRIMVNSGTFKQLLKHVFKKKKKKNHIVALSNHRDSLLETVGTHTGIFQIAGVAHPGLLSHLLANDWKRQH